MLGKLKSIKAGLNKVWAQYVSPYNRRKFAKIGKHSVVQSGSTLVPENMIIDDHCVIQDHINFISNKGKLIVKKYSVISSGCTIIPGAHKLMVGVPFYLSTMKHVGDEEGDIIIEEDCWIGAGCILLPKCHIRRGAVVGAGSIVKKDIPPYAVAVGTPARIIATKFSIDQIIAHESVLYPPAERMSRDELETLFKEYYTGLKAIGTDGIEKSELSDMFKSLEMTDYSESH